jgi:hypothetical protein
VFFNYRHSFTVVVLCTVIAGLLAIFGCTSGTSGEEISVQEGNTYEVERLKTNRLLELKDNRIGGQRNGLSASV